MGIILFLLIFCLAAVPCILAGVISHFVLSKSRTIFRPSPIRVALVWIGPYFLGLVFFLLGDFSGDPLWPDQDMTAEQAAEYERGHSRSKLFYNLGIISMLAAFLNQAIRLGKRVWAIKKENPH